MKQEYKTITEEATLVLNKIQIEELLKNLEGKQGHSCLIIKTKIIRWNDDKTYQISSSLKIKVSSQ